MSLEHGVGRKRHAWGALGLGPLWVRRAPAAHTTPEEATPPVAPSPPESIPQPGSPPPPAPVRPMAPPVARAQPPAVQPPAPLPATAPVRPGMGAWDALQLAVHQCRDCALCGQRRQAVFGTGGAAARWMVVGEAPGAEEDLRGEPFVGVAGQLLDRMLHAIQLRRGEDLFITNVLKCRPPRNRDPEPNEVAACRRHLNAQLLHVRPAIILTVGRFAAQTVLGQELPMRALRGSTHTVVLEGRTIPVVCTWHPSYLLRSPLAKREAWHDLLRARAVAAAAQPPTPP